MDRNDSLKGRRVLVVEDEMMLAMLVEEMLADLGCTVVGPAHALASGLDLAGGGQIDVALLDVNLGGQPVFPIADALRAKGVPVIFCTGYGKTGLRDVDHGAQVLQKPFRAADLANALSQALGASTPSS
jgi:CheY-like chemotaxis protein